MWRGWWALCCLVVIVAALGLGGVLEVWGGSARVLTAVPVLDNPASVLFVGDIMLDRNVARHARDAGDDALFAGIRSLFLNHDLVIGNLEGTLTEEQSIAQQDSSVLRFTFEPKFAQLLASLGFSAVSLANNHALDFGKTGYDETVAHATAAGLAVFGSPFNNERLAMSFVVGNKKICLVGYHELFDPDPTIVLDKIATIRPDCTRLVVMAHWGVEYELEPTSQQRIFAHDFIDAGADVVIGSHPHIVQPLEIYKGKAIFYSLGNFIFDQAFQPEVKRGLAVDVLFENDSTRFFLTPVTTYEETAYAFGATADAVLADVASGDLPAEIKETILTQSSFELKDVQ